MELLEPHVATAFGSVEWPKGFTPRILLATKLHKQAIEKVHHEHGIADPRSKNPGILKIIEVFAPNLDPAITSQYTKQDPDSTS